MINVQYPAERSGQIQVVDGLLDESTCMNFLSRMEQLWDKSSPGKTIGGVQPVTKLSNDLHYSQRYVEDWRIDDVVLDTAIFTALRSAIAIYKQAYPHLNQWITMEDTGFQVQKYNKAQGYYREHTDSFPGTATERVLAVIIYFNDVEFGGETNFPVHGVKVKPVQGRICLFPAVFTHPHESCVPITSDKWIISSFINNVTLTPDESIHDHDGHTHDEHGDHIHDESPPLIMGQPVEEENDTEYGLDF